jgi:signal transduction histidine kinase
VTNRTGILTEQIKQTCKLTGARWAAWVKRVGDAWKFPVQVGLNRGRRSALDAFLSEPATAAWLAGGLSSGRTRFRNTGLLGEEISCERVFSFGNPQTRSLILVGADDLSREAQAYFRILALQNPAGEGEVREWAGKLTLMDSLIKHLVGLNETAEIASKAAALISEFYHFDLVIVLLLDDDRQNLHYLGVGGAKATIVRREAKFPTGRGIIRHVIQTGYSFCTNNTAEHPDYMPLAGWRAGSNLCAPLIDEHGVFGLLNIEQKRINAFTPDDLPVFELLAGFLSSLMINSRRYSDLQRLVSHLKAAHETALDISSNLDSKTLFKRIVRRAREVVHAKGAALGLVDDTGQILRVSISDSPWHYEEEFQLPLNRGITGYVVHTKKPYLVSDYQNWKERIRPSLPVEAWSVLGVPLLLNEIVLGVLFVMDDEQGKVFSKDEIQLLELLAPQIAVSIQNADLYRELHNRIDAQRQAEKSLLRSARLAAVGEMAAGVAHELNNPLTTITGFVELALLELPDDLPQREELEIVLSEAQRARTVLRRLLDFARQSDNFRIMSNINDLSREVLSLIQPSIQMGNIRIDYQPDENIPLIHVDSNQIKQVLINLVQNALQSMPDGGLLRIETRQNVQHGVQGVEVSVQDTGHGMSAEIQDRIFDPFFTTRPVGSGTGLGLAVSYGIVSEHGGRIDVDSQVGKGSCFTIWLPVHEKNSHA